MKGLFQEFMSWKTQQSKFKGILSQSKNIYQPLQMNNDTIPQSV